MEPALTPNDSHIGARGCAVPAAGRCSAHRSIRFLLGSPVLPCALCYCCQQRRELGRHCTKAPVQKTSHPAAAPPVDSGHPLPQPTALPSHTASFTQRPSSVALLPSSSSSCLGRLPGRCTASSAAPAACGAAAGAAAAAPGTGRTAMPPQQALSSQASSRLMCQAWIQSSSGSWRAACSRLQVTPSFRGSRRNPNCHSKSALPPRCLQRRAARPSPRPPALPAHPPRLPPSQ